MHVMKRNGRLEEVDVGKVVTSLKRYCDLPNVDVYRIATKTINGLVDNVSTLELDLLSVRTAKDLIIDDPVYAKVAARILANIIQKEVSGQDIQSFSQSIEIGLQQGLIAKSTYDLVMNNKRKLNAAVKHERDWLLEYHGLQTVYDRYLLKHPTLLNADKTTGKKQRAVIETPQYFLMRVACGLANDAAEVVEMYNLLSSLEYMCSTPTLFNSGTAHSQLASCYLLDSPLDSLDDLYKRYGDIAMLSKFAGGIGVSMSRIRSKGSLIKGTNGQSNGIVPWVHTLSGSVAAVNQGGKRRGAACVYLETHHRDIMQFLEMRDNTGDKESRAYNLNLANWVSDLFMKRVKEDAIWSLFDPITAPELNDLYGEAYERRYIELETEGKFTEQLPARKLYARMMRTLAENGNGWMTWKDTCNRRGNQVNDDAGTVIHLSNLCVAPETLILTRSGYTPIVDLVDKVVEVWNGSEWSETVVRQTGVNQPLITVTLSNGLQMDCTPYHKFKVVIGSRNTGLRDICAGDLKPGDKLIRFALPVIEGVIDFPHAYTHGFFCGDGTYSTQTDIDRPFVTLYGTKKLLVPELETISGTGVDDAIGRLTYRLPLSLPPKFTVPSAQHTLMSRIEWLCGLVDADGCATKNGINGRGIQIGSIDKGFLRNVLLMLQTIGIHSHINKMRGSGTTQFRSTERTYPTQPMFRLLIGSAGVNSLLSMGARFNRISITEAASGCLGHFAKVLTVEDHGRTDDTYCFTESKRHQGMFNGILTSQCTEIIEVTSSGKRVMMARDQIADLTSAAMIEQNINVIGFDTQTDRFEVLQGAEVAVCLAAGSQILTNDGYKLIEECDGANVMVPFENDYDFSDAPRFVRATLIDNGIQPVWQIRLSNGNSVCATSSHKFLIDCIGNTRDWVTVDGLDVGMQLTAFGVMHDDDSATILSITPGGSEQVYDLYVPDAHHFIVAGIVSHNCNLGSINIGRGYIRNGKLDKEKLHRNVAIAVKYLDRVIDRNFYPIPEARASNMRWRPVGLGLMGLADFFFQMRIPFDSQQAVTLSSEIQEEIYYQALRTSCDLAKEFGPHRDFHLTRAAQGHLQMDLAGVLPKDPARWDALRLEIKEHGLRNSLLLAGAPTATISHICGVEETIEPIKSNLLKRETLSGEFVSMNKYLVEDLRKLGRWNAETISHLKSEQGNIATLPDLPSELYDLYKTVWEMSMKSLIAHAVARGAWIDQSHSLNMFVDLNKYPEDRRIGVLSSLYMHAWESGVKTTYYLRSKPATRIEQTTNRPAIPSLTTMAEETPVICESCQ